MDVGTIISPTLYMEKQGTQRSENLSMITQLVYQDSKPWSGSRVPALNHYTMHRLCIFPLFISGNAPSCLFSKARDTAFVQIVYSLRGPSQGGIGAKFSLSSVHQALCSHMLQPHRGWFGLGAA